MNPRIAMTRRAILAVAALAVGALGGCGVWPWSSKPTLPELPSVSGSARVVLAWSLPMPRGGVGFQPVLAAGSVWAAASDGTVVRADAASGRTLWRSNAGQALQAGVGSDGELAVVAGRDGSLIALDRDGKPKWSVQTGAEVVTVPSVALGLVLVRTSDNRVAAFETDTGKRRWTFQRQNPPLVLRHTAMIAMDAGAAYVGLPGGRLVALSLDTGALRWEVAVAMPRGSNEIERIADVVGTPLISGREICAATFQGRVGCFDTASGRTLWARELSSPSGLDLDGRLLVVAGRPGRRARVRAQRRQPVAAGQAAPARSVGAAADGAHGAGRRSRRAGPRAVARRRCDRGPAFDRRFPDRRSASGSRRSRGGPDRRGHAFTRCASSSIDGASAGAGAGRTAQRRQVDSLQPAHAQPLGAGGRRSRASRATGSTGAGGSATSRSSSSTAADSSR